MSQVESMACGTPVIGAAEGGLLETVIDGRTGKLIQVHDKKSGIDAIKSVIESTKLTDWESMKDDCTEQAKLFSLEKFEEKLRFHLNLN